MHKQHSTTVVLTRGMGERGEVASRGSEPSEEEEGMVHTRAIGRRLTDDGGLRRLAGGGKRRRHSGGARVLRGRGDDAFEWEGRGESGRLWG
jgi:hypothetical protein